MVSDFKGVLEVRGRELVFLKELTGQQYAMSLLEGFGPTAKDYDITVENRNTGAGARITSDRPMVRLNFWTIRATLCPEPYIQLRIESGRTEKWQTRYQFYTLK